MDTDTFQSQQAPTSRYSRLELGLFPDSATAENAPLPLSVIGVFDQAFDVYKRHFLTLIMIVAVVLLPFQLVIHTANAFWLLPLSSRGSDSDLVVLRFIGYAFLGNPRHGFPGILAISVPFLLSGPISVAVSDIYLGRAISVTSAYRGFFRYIFRLALGYVIALFVFLVAVLGGGLGYLLFVVIVGLLTGRLLPEVGTILAFLLLPLPYILGFGLLARTFALWTPLCVLEGCPISFVTARNTLLTSGKRFGRVWLSLALLPLLVSGLVWILLISTENALGAMNLAPAIRFGVDAFILAATSCFLHPYWMIFLTLLYYDSRVERECFDVRMLSARMPEYAPNTHFIPMPLSAPVPSPGIGLHRNE